MNGSGSSSEDGSFHEEQEQGRRRFRYPRGGRARRQWLRQWRWRGLDREARKSRDRTVGRSVREAKSSIGGGGGGGIDGRREQEKLGGGVLRGRPPLASGGTSSGKSKTGSSVRPATGSAAAAACSVGL